MPITLTPAQIADDEAADRDYVRIRDAVFTILRETIKCESYGAMVYDCDRGNCRCGTAASAIAAEFALGQKSTS